MVPAPTRATEELHETCRSRVWENRSLRAEAGADSEHGCLRDHVIRCSDTGRSPKPEQSPKSADLSRDESVPAPVTRPRGSASTAAGATGTAAATGAEFRSLRVGRATGFP